MLLYSYKLAGEYKGAVQSGTLPSRPAGSLMVELIGTLDTFLGAERNMLYRRGSKTLSILYRDVLLRCEDLMEYGGLLAGVNKKWKLSVSGSTPSRETGEMEFFQEGGRIIMKKYCVSGKDFHQLDSLCLRLQAEEARTAEYIYRVLRKFQADSACCAVDRVLEPFLKGQQLEFFADGMLFCYLTFVSDVMPEEYLYSLSLSQKERLWGCFLEDDMQTREFDWLYDLLAQGKCRRLLEWELALQNCLENLQFQVKNTPDGFSVADGRGKIRIFDFEKGGAAERAFLKILFPLGR